jgi:hypothetical protein
LTVLGQAALTACRPTTPAIECGPGGRCASVIDQALAAPAAALGLEDLRRLPRDVPDREVLAWQVSWPTQGGRLTRFVVIGGTVREQRFEWWRTDESATSERRRKGDGPYCIGAKGSLAGVTACEVRGSAMPYSTNILRMLDSAGLSTLAGGAPPTQTDNAPDCAGDVCMGPGALVIENRTPTRYRTYGYTLHMEIDSASRRALALWQALQPPAFP